MKDIFRKVSNRVSHIAGNASTFLFAFLIIVIWATTGPLFDFSDTWQLVINTGTTIVTFLMVFLIQNTQNRDSKAMQLKLDELILATRARNAFVNLEDLTDEELAQLNTQFKDVHERAEGSKLMIQLHESIEAEHERRKHRGVTPTHLNEILHKKI
jgi:low affinity Fe/Cu permease